MSDVPRDPLSNPAPYDPVTSAGANVELDKTARNWAMLCHLASLAGFVGPLVLHIGGPLLVWVLKKSEHPFIDEQGKESLNFQISMTIYMLFVTPLICVIVGIFLIAALVILDAVFAIFAAIKAGDGVHYRYPMTIRFVR